MFKRFRRNTDGNIAMMFGVCTMMLVVVIGAAVDYSALSSQSKTLQDYTDAAVLAAAVGSEKKTNKEIRKTVKDTIKAHNQNNWKIKSKISFSDETIIVATSTVYKPMIMSAVGYKEIPISVTSAAPRSKETPLDIAFVLDSTFSMRDGNLADLQVAAGQLVDKLDAMDNDYIRMSVVPFNEYVNVGLSNRNAPWLDVDADDVQKGPEVCTPYTPQTRSGCTPVERTGSRDGISFTWTAQENCTYTPSGPEEMRCSSPTTFSQTWKGCVGSRAEPRNTKAKVNNGKRVPGIMNISPAPPGHHNPTCGTEILEMTNNYTDVKSRINSMNPTGYGTYIPTGLLWGWRTLERNNPFPLVKPLVKGKSSGSIKALLLMSDGANTVRKEGVYHIVDRSDDSVPGVGIEANELTTEMCDGIKSDQIVVFTVAYNFPSDPTGTKAVLENCATSSANYFDANNAAELEAAFSEIGNQLFAVRLSQ